jgi:predicted dithiol-disulfide oxidoreductase (DUF899 family)
MVRTIHNRVVSREEWIAARRQLLVKEKELTRRSDQLSEERRELPWVWIDKEYIFDGPDGTVTLAELFGNRSHLVITHFMLDPGWEEGCVGCSFGAGHVGEALVHLEHHDVSYVAVSRAPLSQIEAFSKRMGWRFKWVSSFGSDFNEEMPGISIFYQDESGDVYHTYSAYGRGTEDLRSQCPEKPAFFCLFFSNRLIPGV